MDTKRKRTVAATAKSARSSSQTAAKSTRSRKSPATPRPRLAKYSFDLDQIRIIGLTIGSTGVVVTPPRPRPFGVPIHIELTIEQAGLRR